MTKNKSTAEFEISLENGKLKIMRVTEEQEGDYTVTSKRGVFIGELMNRYFNSGFIKKHISFVVKNDILKGLSFEEIIIRYLNELDPASIKDADKLTLGDYLFVAVGRKFYKIAEALLRIVSFDTSMRKSPVLEFLKISHDSAGYELFKKWLNLAFEKSSIDISGGLKTIVLNDTRLKKAIITDMAILGLYIDSEYAKYDNESLSMLFNNLQARQVSELVKHSKKMSDFVVSIERFDLLPENIRGIFIF